MSGATTFSVVMCTYNGANHVATQTTSIVRQLTDADELIISDDGSTDDTVELALAATEGTRANVRVLVAPQQRGVAKNFEHGIAQADREIVLLADQDDLWRADKVAVMRQVFARNTNVVAAFSDARLLDENGIRDKRLWDVNGVDRFVRRRLRRGRVFEQLLRRNTVTGATLAFRRSVAEVALPIDAVTMHDYWIGLVAASIGDVVAIEQPLVDYRVHRHQLVGPESPSLRGQMAARRDAPDTRAHELAMFLELSARVRGRLDSGRQLLLDEKVAFLRRRASLPHSVVRRVPGVAGDLAKLRYHRFGRGLRSAGRDVIFGH